jgi:hypothetical protein
MAASLAINRHERPIEEHTVRYRQAPEAAARSNARAPCANDSRFDGSETLEGSYRLENVLY